VRTILIKGILLPLLRSVVTKRLTGQFAILLTFSVVHRNSSIFAKRSYAINLNARTLFSKLHIAEFRKQCTGLCSVGTILRGSMTRKTRIKKLRTRYGTPIRTEVGVFDKDGNKSIVSIYDQPSQSMTDWTVKPGSLLVVKTPSNSTIGWRANDGSYSYTSGVSQLILDPNITYRDCVMPYETRLKNKKLATSNQADLLTNLAEFDDTLAMLGNTVKKKPTYGAVEWGWMPLVSDILAANDAANNVKQSLLSEQGIRSNKYVTRDTFTVKSIKVPLDIGLPRPVLFQHTWDVTIKWSGYIYYQNDILAFYDYMGFHPSPKLLWDLVPLSFAVDKLLPIGDMLSELTPTKGWVKAANFTGWRTIKAKVTETATMDPKLDYGKYTSVEFGGSLELVNRVYLDGITLEEKRVRKTIEALKTPTWKDAFDLTYLSEAFYNRGKAIFRPHVYRKAKK